MADKSSQLVLNALSRAAAEANGLPLHGGKALPGLFPTTPLGKQTAQRCVRDGHLRPASSGPTAGYVLTDKGLSFLLEQASPRQVLEDLVRVLEARQSQMGELLQLAGHLRADLTQLQASAERVLQQVPQTAALTASMQLPASPNGERLPRTAAADHRCTENGEANKPPFTKHEAPFQQAILARLDRWQISGASEDCPLPELFCQLRAAVPGLSIGRFHDALRALHDADQIYLHPWTGPLYDLPEPAYALLVGHLIAYYASSRATEAVTEPAESQHLLRFPVK